MYSLIWGLTGITVFIIWLGMMIASVFHLAEIPFSQYSTVEYLLALVVLGMLIQLIPKAKVKTNGKDSDQESALHKS